MLAIARLCVGTRDRRRILIIKHCGDTRSYYVSESELLTKCEPAYGGGHREMGVPFLIVMQVR